MLRNALIAIYILAVLAISAVTRAEEEAPVVVKPKRLEGSTVNPSSVDPLPSVGMMGRQKAVMLSFGNGEVR